MRLIDVDTLIQEIKSLKIILNAKSILNDDAKDTVLRIIDEQLIVDLAEHDKQIKADAIEEFLNEVEEWDSYCVFHRYDDFCEMHKIMKKVAEQLKENNNG